MGWTLYFHFLEVEILIMKTTLTLLKLVLFDPRMIVKLFFL